MLTVVPLFRNFVKREVDILSGINALIQSIHLWFFYRIDLRLLDKHDILL